MRNFNEVLPILKRLFRMNQYRINKCRILFELAQQADGEIVELGSFHGMSTIALERGSGDNQVSAIDSWNNVGWVGETYTQNDYRIFEDNIEQAGASIKVFKTDIADKKRIDYFEDKVALLFWDTGVEDCLMEHFRLWSKCIKPGGLFLIHDTADYRLGWNGLKEYMQAYGDLWEFEVEEYAPLHGLRKV